MNREEAKQLIYDKRDDTDKIHLLSLFSVIEDIYDDFESRTCESCKYISADKNKCNANNSAIVWLDIETFSDFGCNQFERI